MIKRIASVVAAGAMMWLVGCSGESAVGVSDTPLKPVALIGDVDCNDIASAGNNKWLRSWTPQGPSGNYQLFYWVPDQNNPDLGNWVGTTSYGVRISVSASGRCYHFNTDNQIWWRTPTENGSIPNPQENIIIKDIGAGLVGTDNVVWINCLDQNYNPMIWKYRGGSWVELTPGMQISDKIAVDPNNGNSAVIIAESSNRIYKTTDETRWYLQSGSPRYTMTISNYGSKIVCSDILNWIYVGSNNKYTQKNIHSYSVCAESNYFYYIQANMRVAKASY